jgi:hypothetical protein
MPKESRERSKTYYQKLKNSGLCVRCRAATNNNEALCADCKTQRMVLHDTRKQDGLCIGCGQVPPELGRLSCAPCLEQALQKNRKHLYGLTQEQYLKKLISQNWACDICHDPFDEDSGPYIDHDHECCPGIRSCGKCLRSFLCRTCNTQVGGVESALAHVLGYIANWKISHGKTHSWFVRLFRALV